MCDGSDGPYPLSRRVAPPAPAAAPALVPPDAYVAPAANADRAADAGAEEMLEPATSPSPTPVVAVEEPAALHPPASVETTTAPAPALPNLGWASQVQNGFAHTGARSY